MKGGSIFPKFKGFTALVLALLRVLILLLELWIPSNFHFSALLRRNEGWAHLPKVQGIHSSSISTPQSANTIIRAVNPFKPPLLSPPLKEWRVGPSSQSPRDSQGGSIFPKFKGFAALVLALLRVLILLLELWIPSNLHSSALLRRNEGWAHLPKVQAIRSSSISTPQSANTITRAVNPFKPPLLILSPPQKEWRVGPSSQSSRDSQL